jgi:hypothetical protein
MKKFLLSITAIVSFSICEAQPSYNLEAWTANSVCSTVQDPTGWASFNMLNCFPVNMPLTVEKETTPAPFQGLAAAKITTQKIPSFVTVPGYDTVGLLVLGSISLSGSAPQIKYGVNYTNRPATVTFATKYEPHTNPNPNDTGWVLVQLTKWNGTKADTIASGKFTTTAASSTWTARTIDLTSSYVNQNVAPDTLKIYCSSSSLYRPSVGSILWVDDFQFNGYVGINEIEGVTNNVSVFPNPASNSVSIKCSVSAKSVDVIDVTGRKVGNYPMKNNEVLIETNSFIPGLYLYNVVDNDKKVINRGKFEVAH